MNPAAAKAALADGSPFKVLDRDLWFASNVLRSKFQSDRDLAQHLLLTRLLKRDKLPVDLKVVVPADTWSPEPAPFFVSRLVFRVLGQWVLFACWQAAQEVRVRSPESFRCLRREYVPTYSIEFLRACEVRAITGD